MKKLFLFLNALVITAGAGLLRAETQIYVSIVNQSGYPDNQVYLYVTGDDGSTHGYYDFNAQSYVVPRFAAVTEMTTTLDQIPATGNKRTFGLPGIGGGRIYFAYGADFDVLDFDSVNGQPGYGPADLLLYDKVEFTTSVPGQLNMNNTNVDFFSLPFTFEAVDKNTGRKPALRIPGRKRYDLCGVLRCSRRLRNPGVRQYRYLPPEPGPGQPGDNLAGDRPR